MIQCGSLSQKTSIQLDALELWVGNFNAEEQMLTNLFGFRRIDHRFSEQTQEKRACFVCGNVSIILREGSGEGSRVAKHVAKHGDSFVDIALACKNFEKVLDRALKYGLGIINKNDYFQIDLLGNGTILHSIRDNRIFSNQEPGKQITELQMRGVDHITYCLPCGEMDHVADIYRKVFDMQDVQAKNVQIINRNGNDQKTANGMRSIVLRSGTGLTLVLTEPASSAFVGQTHQFLQAHRGAGVQHIAVLYDDIISAVKLLRSNGVKFLPIPEEHLKVSQQRLRNSKLCWSELRNNEILVDFDDDGLIFQLFTLPITENGRFFVELIQRTGSTGFGTANVDWLFSAVDAAINDPTLALWKQEKGD
jgi:4-hydroxyphenylpyruvate dioxygenase